MTAVELALPGEEPLLLDDGVLASLRDELTALDAAAETGSIDAAAPSPGPPPPCRLAYAAAHVVMKLEYAEAGHSLERPGAAAEIAGFVDWEATSALRCRIANHGFGIAEAMDTAQRFELGWPAAERLIVGTGALGLERGFVAGAATDHLDGPPMAARPDSPAAREELAAAWAWQANRVLAAGGTPVLLPQPALTAWGLDPDGFVAVYRGAIERADGPVYLHWLGEMFHPAMRGYFPGDSFERILALGPERVTGAKLSLLDAGLERRVRRAIAPRGQLVLTGDDFHFADLIAGDGPEDFSHALLGVFDAIAAPAGLALRFLAHGRRDRYDAVMAPCEALGQAVFEPPTRHYKAGLAFLAWLNGWQDNPMLVNREDFARDREHLLRITRLASAAGCLEDATLAAERLEARFHS